MAMIPRVGKHHVPRRRYGSPLFVATVLSGVGLVATTAAVVADIAQEPVSPSVANTAAEDVIVDQPLETAVPTSTVPAANQPNFAKCPPTARACVDLTAKKSWLQKNGAVEYGPVDINYGRPGWETPPGNYHVMRHVKDEVSYEWNMEPMPYSTYFSPLGIAFHEGNLAEQSHGCVHLKNQDAIHYFNTLKVNDPVSIF